MRRRIFSMLASVLLLLAAACGGGGGPQGPTITVGSAAFSESVILAEIYAQALEAEGYSVDRKLNVGSREVYFPAMERGEIDFLPEYTGNLLRFLTGEEELPDGADAVYEAVADELDGRNLTALERSDADNKDAIVVSGETAEELELERVSDLAPHASDLVFGGPPECPERPACLIGLRETYGLSFREIRSLDPGSLTVTALERGAIDVALMFSTDGVIADKGFVVLEDDRGIAGFQNIFPVARDEIAETYGDDFVELVNSITVKLTTDGLTELNKRADVDNEDPDEVAASWLRDNGFA